MGDCGLGYVLNEHCVNKTYVVVIHNEQDCRSKLTQLFHKKSGWKHAATAIMEDGLPTLQQPERRNDATAHIKSLGQLAHTLAAWLKAYASHMRAYRDTRIPEGVRSFGGYNEEKEREALIH